MTERIKKILNKFCAKHGGGDCKILVESGFSGGYAIAVVWDGFADKEISSQVNQVMDALQTKLTRDEFSKIRRLRLYTYQEFNHLMEEEAVAYAIPSDPPWLR